MTRQSTQARVPASSSWGILALIAEFENDIRRERQMDGIRKAHERGVRFGRKPISRASGLDSSAPSPTVSRRLASAEVCGPGAFPALLPWLLTSSPAP